MIEISEEDREALRRSHNDVSDITEAQRARILESFEQAYQEAKKEGRL